MALAPYATSREAARHGCELLWIIAARSRCGSIVSELYQVVYRLALRARAMSVRIERRTCYATWTGEAVGAIRAAELAPVSEDAGAPKCRSRQYWASCVTRSAAWTWPGMPVEPLTASPSAAARRAAILANESRRRRVAPRPETRGELVPELRDRAPGAAAC